MPYSGWTWYITEMYRDTGECFGLAEGLETELGYFDLTELAETTVLGGGHAVERDLYWQPLTLGEIKNGFRKDLPRGEEIAPSEVVNVEEFLFGAVADDAPANAAGALPAENEADDAGDPET